MKFSFLKSLVIILLMGTTGSYALSAEFLVKDSIAVINPDIHPWEASAKWLFDGVGPANWQSPDDFYNGAFHMRFEIISQPTSRYCGAQFVIWQDWAYPIWKEQASGHTLLYGPGDIAYTTTTPASWWAHDDVPLDFSRPHDFYKFGVMIWSMDPFGQIAYYRVDDGEWNIYDEIWEDRHEWFPMTFRLTVVAVSAGSAFSGNWAAYMGGGDPGIQPAYSIDYFSEKTNEDILTQHEYSYNNSSWYDGTGAALSLTPSAIVYFRDKNDNGLTQTLTVPARPATPSFNIDFVNERTSATVSPAYEYCGDISMSGAPVGTGGYVNLFPGENRYFRQLATASSFKSEIQTLAVPARPDAPTLTIDYTNGITTESIGSDLIYSLSYTMSNPTSGSGDPVSLTPGQDVWFEYVATASDFASEIFRLEVDTSPEPPCYTIKHADETTQEDVPSSVIYSDDIGFSDFQAGADAPVVLSPGVDTHFKVAATASSFESKVFSAMPGPRPEFSSISSSPTRDNPIQVDLTFGHSTSSLDTNKLILLNARLSEITGEYTLSLVPEAEGMVSIQLEANAVAEGNFSSDIYSITYEEEEDPDALNNPVISGPAIYPNPTQGVIRIDYAENYPWTGHRIKIIDSQARQVYFAEIREERTDIDLRRYGYRGIFLIQWVDENSAIIEIRKVILE